MEAVTLLKEIKSHELDIQAIEGNLHVSPSAKITDSIRQTIRQHKDALVDFIETYEERAAIMEYDAGLSREQAEILAFHDLTKGHNL
jgi:hypothetical protein